MPKEPRTDEELLAGCLAGDKQCWDAFVEQFSRLVYWSIRKTLSAGPYQRRQEVCDDLFQDFFAKLLERGELAKLRNASSLRKFLSVTACHLAMDRVKGLSRFDRKTARAGTAMDAEEERLVPEGRAIAGGAVSDPRTEAITREAQAALSAALSELSAKERACVELHYLDGLAHAEVAGILGLPLGTVSTVIRRTREKLRRSVLEKGPETL